MNILITILLVLGGIIALLLIAALFMKKDNYVKREIIINAPRQKVFDFVKLLENQEKFNKHAMAGPARKRKYKGTDGTVGFIYSWKGDKSAGEGEKEIKSIIEGKRVEMEIRFVKPMRTSASIIMETESLSDSDSYRDRDYISDRIDLKLLKTKTFGSGALAVYYVPTEKREPS